MGQGSVLKQSAGPARLAGAVFGALSACSLGSPSGVYVAKNSSSAALLQIVRSEGGHLNGRFEEVGLESDGSVKDLGADVTGVIDGQNIVISAAPVGLPLGKVTLSGTLQMGHLHLAGSGFGGPLILELDRADERAFDVQAAALRAKGNEIIAANTKAAAERGLALQAANKLQLVQQDIAALQAFSLRAEDTLPKIGAVGDRYREISAQMRAGLSRERSITGDGQASVARGQISVALSQASITAGNIQVSENNARRDLVSFRNAVVRASVIAKAACDDATAGRLGPVAADAWKSACTNRTNAAQAARGEDDKLRSAYTQLDTIWAAESANQTAIVKAGEQAAD